jgi:Ca2+-dependent lipid-binding protein
MLYIIDRSTVQTNTRNPVWNELWRVNNVPATAKLNVEVWDKDDCTLSDDYIGRFSTTVDSGTKEIEIQGSLFRRGTFWLKVGVLDFRNGDL